MGDPHAFAGLVDLPPAEDDRPKVTGGPPPGQCVFCGAPSGTRRLCPKHTCTGGEYLELAEGGRWTWKRTKACGKPVRRWARKAEPPPEEDATSPRDELGEFGARPKQGLTLEWIYGALCEDCTRAERDGREQLRKQAEGGDKPEPTPGRKRTWR